jgi:hypothetical protein
VSFGKQRASAVEVAAFIAVYKAADRGRIEFLSNGERGPALRDANDAFRGEVCRAARGGQAASDELIRDLYDAESQWSQAAWCVRHETIAFLAGELLRRGGPANVRHYLECMWRGQDCYLSSLCVRLSLEERAAAVAEITGLAAAGGPAATRWQAVADNLARVPESEA